MLHPLIGILGLSFAFELHAGCGSDAPFCPVQPFSSELQRDVMGLQKQLEEKAVDFLKDADALQNSSSEPRASFQQPKSPRLYVFVSLSMPEAALMALGERAKKVDGVLVLRGLKEGSFKKTVQALKTFVEKTGYGLTIDPVLFKRFEVTAVPTFVIAEDQTSYPPAISLQAPAYDKVSGNVTLDYALSRFAASGEIAEAKALLKQLRGEGQ